MLGMFILALLTYMKKK
ncbi:hypothetical protein [Paenibacillus sp. HGF5]|nr:hypothetical protein [Paenibacillus sp. HGF5]